MEYVKVAELVKVAEMGDVPPGRGRCVDVAGTRVALFNVGGAYHAIQDLCPHAHGPLSEGDLSGTVVACPWHAWRFDVTTGVSPLSDQLRVPRYPVRVEGQAVLVGTQPQAAP